MIAAAVIGHRGAAAVAPENTLASFRAAAAEGAKWVECDAQLLVDGTVVVFHDADLGRCTDGTGPLQARRWPEIASLDAGRWFGEDFAGERIPRLAEVLSLCAELRLGVNVELKDVRPGRREAMAGAVLTIMNTVGPGAGWLVSSFDHEALAAVHRRRPDLPIGLLCQTLPADWEAAAARVGARSVHLPRLHAEAAALAAIRSAGLESYIFTVNEPAEAARLRALGASGVFTDDPGLLVRGGV